MAFIRNTDKLIEGSSKLFFSNVRAKAAVQSDLNNLSSSISSEQAARQSEESGIKLRLGVIEGGAGVSGSIAKAQADAQAYADQKVAALVNSAPAVLDTLKELSDAIGGDASFASTVAGQIGAVDDKVDQEILDRQAAISSLQSSVSSSVSGLESAIEAEESRAMLAEGALDGRLDLLEADPVTKSYIDGEISSVEGQVSAEQSRAMAAEGLLDGRLDVLEQNPTTKAYVDGQVSAERSAREAADSALDARLDILEQDETTKAYVDQQVSAEQSRAQGAESALDGRLDILEQDPTTKSYVDGEVSDLQGQVEAEEVRAMAAEGLLDGRLDILELDPVTKTYVDGAKSNLQGQITAEVSARQSAVSSEASARQSADQALDGRLDVLESDPTTKSYVDAEISSVEGQISQEISNRQSAVSGEQSRAQAAEAALDGRLDALELDPVSKTYVDGQVSGLQGQVTTEKGRIDAILSASQADKDSFAEIVSLINSVDTANDSAFAGYVTSNNAALAAEVSARQSAVSAEQSAREAADQALDGRLDALELDPVTKSYVDGADSTLQSNINGLFASKSTSDLVEGSRLYFTDLRAKSAAVVDSSSGSQTDQAMSVSAAKSYIDAADALRLKLDGSNSMTGQLNIDLSANPQMAFRATSMPTLNGIIGAMNFQPYNGTGYSSSVKLSGIATEGHTSSARGSKLNIEATANGSTSRTVVASFAGNRVDMFQNLYVNSVLIPDTTYVDSADNARLKLDGSNSMTGSLSFTGASGKNILWNTDGGGNIGAPGANRPTYLYVKDTGYFGGFLQVGQSISWATDGVGDIGSSTNFRPNNIYAKTSVTSSGKAVFTQSNAAAPGYTFGGATTSGMYYDTNLVGISVAGSAAVRCLPTAVITDKVLAVNAGMGMTRTAVSANYTVTGSETVMGVTSTSAARVITLPSAVTYSGRQFIVKDESGSASVSNYIRIAPQSGQLIDGESNFEIVVPYESVTVYSNGQNWFIL
jgi:hypothetical protein